MEIGNCGTGRKCGGVNRGFCVMAWPSLCRSSQHFSRRCGLLFVRPRFLFSSPPLFSVAANGGVAAGFASTAIAALLIRLLFVQQAGLIRYGGDREGMERMGGFVLVAML